MIFFGGILMILFDRFLTLFLLGFLVVFKSKIQNC